MKFLVTTLLMFCMPILANDTLVVIGQFDSSKIITPSTVVENSVQKDKSGAFAAIFKATGDAKVYSYSVVECLHGDYNSNTIEFQLNNNVDLFFLEQTKPALLFLTKENNQWYLNKVREVRKDFIEGWVLDYSSIDKILEKLSSNISVSDSVYKRLKELWKRFDCSSEPPHIHRETIRVVDYIGEFNF